MNTLKRYKVTVSLGISAENKHDAKDKLIAVIESGSVVYKDKFYGVAISDKKGIYCEELPF